MANIIIPSYIRGNVYATYFDMLSPTVKSQVIIAELSDLHLWTAEMIGKKNVLLAKDAIERENPDIIVISGDIVNDAGDLRDSAFCEKLREIIRKLTGDRLCIIDKGNHDLAALEGKDWKKADDKLLNEALAPLSNVYFLDEVTNLYLKDNQSLAAKGLSTVNVNFVGGNLPWEFYYNEKENPKAFIEHWKQRFGEQGDAFIDDAFNILDMHAIGNFIELYRDLGLIPQKVSIALAGHQHGGMVPEGLNKLIPGNRGGIAPTMELFPKYQRGVEICGDGDTVVSIGNSTNVRVETPILNDMEIYGPSVRFIRLMPAARKRRARIKHEIKKFR